MTIAAQPEFYAEFVSRNTGFIESATQTRLADATVLIAGCGSTGGAAVEPLARIGVQNFVLADNGSYELNNLNRQHARQTDLGRNKAEVSAELIRSINPYARVAVHQRGVELSTVDAQVAGADVIIDGVDVTERSGMRAKWALHVSAAAHRIPVISGYDMAGMQFVRCYDYRVPSQPLYGAVTASDVEISAPFTLLARLIPKRKVPIEMIRNLRDSMHDPDYHVSQLVYTSLMFGAIASRMTVELLAGADVRRHVAIDVHRFVRRPRANGRLAIAKPIELIRTLRNL